MKKNLLFSKLPESRTAVLEDYCTKYLCNDDVLSRAPDFMNLEFAAFLQTTDQLTNSYDCIESIYAMQDALSTKKYYTLFSIKPVKEYRERMRRERLL